MTNYFETLISEKSAHDLDDSFEVEGPSGANWMTYQNVVDAIASAPKSEQTAIRNNLIRIDFANGDVFHYFRHLAQAIAI